MKTNEQLETLIQNLIDRLNRIEANVANMSNQVSVMPIQNAPLSAVDNAIRSIEAAVSGMCETHSLLERLRKDA